MLTVINGKVVPGPEIWNSVKQNMVKEGQGQEVLPRLLEGINIVLPPALNTMSYNTNLPGKTHPLVTTIMGGNQILCNWI